MRKLGSGWVCEDCKSFGKEGEVTPHSPQCPSKEVPFGPPKDVGVSAGFNLPGSEEGGDPDRIVREAELSPAEMAEIGGERLEERVEPQPPTDLELKRPAAKLEDLQALAGLPTAEEERCGAPGPDGLTCRLKPGHEGGLHAARGRTWTDAEAGLEPHQAAAREGLWKTSLESALEERLINAIERGAAALEGIRQAVQHYVEEMLHRTR